MPLLDGSLRYGREYARGFGMLFWSFAFQVDYRVRGLDILPDFLGYMVVVTAAGLLVRFHSDAAKVRLYAVPLIFLGLLDLFEPSQAPQGATQWLVAGGITLASLRAGLDILLVWRLCGIVADLAHHVGATGTERSAVLRRELYAGYALYAAFLLAMSVLALVDDRFELDAIVVLFGLFFGIAILALLMELMKQAEHLLRMGLPAVGGPQAGAPAETEA